MAEPAIHREPGGPGCPQPGDLVVWGFRWGGPRGTSDYPGLPSDYQGLARLVRWGPDQGWVLTSRRGRFVADWIRHLTPEELALHELGEP